MHKFLFRLLKMIPQDCTFDQGKLLERLSKVDSVKYSCDLSAATDRFPIKVISAILRGRFPSVFIEAWEDIMVGYSFERKDLPPISYSVGNPMGAYTSWAAFTLAHHFVVYDAGIEAGIAWRLIPYAILGDDIVIANAKVAEIYLRKMSELGVEISLAKSHISKDMMEFAKRLFYKQVEISPFPLSAVKETSSRAFLLTGLLLEQLRRGWALPALGKAIAAFYSIVFAANGRFRSKVTETATVVSQLDSAIKGLMPGAVFLKEFCVRNKVPTPFSFTQEDFERILSFSAIEAFADSFENLRKGDESLGDLAINLTMSFFDEGFQDSDE